MSGMSFGRDRDGASPIINTNLTWEKSEQYDLGLDVDLFDYRLKLKADYYYKYTKSMLWQVSLPGTVYVSKTVAKCDRVF